jgi:hypothetical protein
MFNTIASSDTSRSIVSTFYGKAVVLLLLVFVLGQIHSSVGWTDTSFTPALENIRKVVELCCNTVTILLYIIHSLLLQRYCVSTTAVLHKSRLLSWFFLNCYHPQLVLKFSSHRHFSGQDKSRRNFGDGWELEQCYPLQRATTTAVSRLLFKLFILFCYLLQGLFVACRSRHRCCPKHGCRPNP